MPAQQAGGGGSACDVMISYRVPETGAGGDNSVFALQAALQMRGFSVFVGDTAIVGGSSWPETIQRGVEQCKAFVVLCSPTYGDGEKSPWTMRELVLADNLKKPLIPVWHSGVYPPTAVAIYLGEKQRIPIGDYRNGYAAANIAHDKVAEELAAALVRAGVPCGAMPAVQSTSSSVSAVDEAAASGTDVASLTQWLTRIGLAKHEASVIPKLASAGVLNVEELEEVEEGMVEKLGLPLFEEQKLANALRAMLAERKAEEYSANIIKSIALYERELNFAQLVATMRAHATNAGVQEAGCRALWNITAKADNQVKAGSAGAIDAVVSAMRAHATIEGILEAGCRALRTLTFNNADNQVKAGAGAVETVVNMMIAHASNAAVQEHGCRALINMTCYADNQVKAGSAGAIEAVVDMMIAHASNAAVQEYGCRALINMTCYADNQVKAGSAGAIEAVVAAMRAHASNAAVQEYGCMALNYITRYNRANKVKAGSAGAFEAVVAAMRAHVSNAGVQEQGCGALHKMIFNNHANHVKAEHAGAIEAVVAAMNAHGGNSGVREDGDTVLKWLRYGGDCTCCTVA